MSETRAEGRVVALGIEAALRVADVDRLRGFGALIQPEGRDREQDRAGLRPVRRASGQPDDLRHIPPADGRRERFAF